MEPVKPELPYTPSGATEVVVAENQQDVYLPLPAVFLDDPQRTIVTRWRLTDEERAAIAAGEDLYIEGWTFGQKLQPMRPCVGVPEEYRHAVTFERVDPVDVASVLGAVEVDKEGRNLFRRNSDALAAHHDALWADLEPVVRERLVAAGVTILGPIDNLPTLRAAIASRPLDWSTECHFFWGMWFRNRLRDAGITDEQVPTGNLDDYYVRTVEEALVRIPVNG